jgi:hypothetical protein
VIPRAVVIEPVDSQCPAAAGPDVKVGPSADVGDGPRLGVAVLALVADGETGAAVGPGLGACEAGAVSVARATLAGAEGTAGAPHDATITSTPSRPMTLARIADLRRETVAARLNTYAPEPIGAPPPFAEEMVLVRCA